MEREIKIQIWQYKFQKAQKGTLKYDFFNKKIIFTKDDTKICDEGCYLLISLKSSAIGNLDEQYRFHIFFYYSWTYSLFLMEN